MLDGLAEVENVRTLQRSLAEAAFMPDPRLLEQDPAAFAAAQGLNARDQAAFLRFRHRLLAYRDFVRSDLTDPIEDLFPITRALLTREGAWEACLSDFLAIRGVQSPYYRDIAPTFLGWLASSTWGLNRWPWLLQLAHSEILTALVERHPGGAVSADLHPHPSGADVLEWDPATQVVSYDYAVQACTEAAPVPKRQASHLMVHRDPDGGVLWKQLTAASAALVVRAQQVAIATAVQDLGLPSLPEALAQLGEFQAQGAIRGFRRPTPGPDPEPDSAQPPG